MGDGLQGVFHAHRPQGWAPTKRITTQVCEGMRRVTIFGTPVSGTRRIPSHTVPSKRQQRQSNRTFTLLPLILPCDNCTSTFLANAACTAT